MKKLILSGVALGMMAASALASGPTQFFDDPHVIGDEPRGPTLCPPHSDRSGEPYVHPWVRDCFNQPDRPTEPEEKPCTSWNPGTEIAVREKDCAAA